VDDPSTLQSLCSVRRGSTVLNDATPYRCIGAGLKDVSLPTIRCSIGSPRPRFTQPSTQAASTAWKALSKRLGARDTGLSDDVVDLLCWAGDVVRGVVVDDLFFTSCTQAEEGHLVEVLSLWLGETRLHVMDGQFGCAVNPRIIVRPTEKRLEVSSGQLTPSQVCCRSDGEPTPQHVLSSHVWDQWCSRGIPTLVFMRDTPLATSHTYRQRREGCSFTKSLFAVKAHIRRSGSQVGSWVPLPVLAAAAHLSSSSETSALKGHIGTSLLRQTYSSLGTCRVSVTSPEESCLPEVPGAEEWKEDIRQLIQSEKCTAIPGHTMSQKGWEVVLEGLSAQGSYPSEGLGGLLDLQCSLHSLCVFNPHDEDSDAESDSGDTHTSKRERERVLKARCKSLAASLRDKTTECKRLRDSNEVLAQENDDLTGRLEDAHTRNEECKEKIETCEEDMHLAVQEDQVEYEGLWASYLRVVEERDAYIQERDAAVERAEQAERRDRERETLLADMEEKVKRREAESKVFRDVVERIAGT
ncbi:hypothetical protein KIPB_011094, partial [Kipferlia bialata]